MKRASLYQVFVITAVISVAQTALAEEKTLDILRIYDQFIMASKAASSCTQPEKDNLDKFLSNFRAVAYRAGEEIKTRQPEWSEKDVLDRMKMRSEYLSQRVATVIEEKGCKDDRIEDLIKRFEMQSQLNFG